MTLKELLKLAMEIREAAAAGQYAVALQKGFELVSAFLDLFSTPSVLAADDKDTVEAIKKTLREARSKCDEEITANKIGDGVFLGRLIDLFEKLLPILLPIIIGADEKK